MRSAQRNKSKPPPLSCTYADDDEPEPLAAANGERKRVSSTTAGPKRAALGGPDKLTRERERRAEEERDTLKARIGELFRSSSLANRSRARGEDCDVDDV